MYTWEDRYPAPLQSRRGLSNLPDDEPLKPYRYRGTSWLRENGVCRRHSPRLRISLRTSSCHPLPREALSLSAPAPGSDEPAGDKVALKTGAQCGSTLIEDSKEALTSADIALREAERIGFQS